MKLRKTAKNTDHANYPLEIVKGSKTYYRMQLTSKTAWYTVRNEGKEILAFIVIDRRANTKTRFDCAGNYIGAYSKASNLEERLNSAKT